MNKNILVVLFAALIFMGGTVNLLADVANDSNGNSCEFAVSTTPPPDLPPTLSGIGNGGGGNPG
jgi:hypothetical protein